MRLLIYNNPEFDKVEHQVLDKNSDPKEYFELAKLDVRDYIIIETELASIGYYEVENG